VRQYAPEYAEYTHLVLCGHESAINDYKKVYTMEHFSIHMKNAAMMEQVLSLSEKHMNFQS
jgi:hypothetical protein